MPIPAVSVVMPVHNAGRFLDNAICSIRLQTLTDLELIIVDDGSTDGSTEILREHAAADPRVSVLRVSHGGVARALNRGLIAARAELVARMDADDEAKPDRLERQLAALEAQPDIAVLGTGCEFIDADGRVISAFVPKADPAELREDLLKANCLMHPTVTMRRRLVLAIGGYRPVFAAAEDYDLWLRLSERHNLSNLPDLLLRYRSHDAQATTRRWRLQLLEVLAAQHAAYLRQAGRPDPMQGLSQIDAAALRAMGVPRRAIRAALKGREVTAPPLPQRRLPGLFSLAMRDFTPEILTRR
jgi:glycosyltransferase involved in cell wall biosynthesis